MKKNYLIQLEISGPSAIWTRPDSGDCPVSYPAPTFSAVKGIFESILWIQALEVVPTKVEICSPIVYHGYNTNYGGPLRKSAVVKTGGSYQLLVSVLVNPCYRLYAEVKKNDHTNGQLTIRTQKWKQKTTCPEHAYKDMFNRRLIRGQSFSIPFLGWKEFAPNYVGPFRKKTQITEDISLRIPSMLRQVFPDGTHSKVRYVYDQDIEIKQGILTY